MRYGVLLACTCLLVAACGSQEPTSAPGSASEQSSFCDEATAALTGQFDQSIDQLLASIERVSRAAEDSVELTEEAKLSVMTEGDILVGKIERLASGTDPDAGFSTFEFTQIVNQQCGTDLEGIGIFS